MAYGCKISFCARQFRNSSRLWSNRLSHLLEGILLGVVVGLRNDARWPMKVAPSSAREVYLTIAVVSIGLMIQMVVSVLLLGH